MLARRHLVARNHPDRSGTFTDAAPQCSGVRYRRATLNPPLVGRAAFFLQAVDSTPTAHHRVARESIVQRRSMLSTRPRVLLADDYPDIVKALSRWLALDFEIVGSVTDGSALLETARRLQPDVIVLDVHLPNVHALEACREMTRVNPKMKVIMFTALDDPNVRRGVPPGRSICLRLETLIRRPAADHQAPLRRSKLMPTVNHVV